MKKLLLCLLVVAPVLAQTRRATQIVLTCVTSSRLSTEDETVIYKDCDDGKVYASKGGDPFEEVLEPIEGTAGGTVTSVAMTVPGFLTLSGSPISVSGTLGLGLASQTALRVFAVGASDGTPSFMALTADHIPTLAESKITGLVADLAAKVPTTRAITAGTGLTGGCADLTADCSFALATPTAAAGAHVHNSTAGTLTDGATTVLTFDTEDQDDAAFHSTVTNTGRMTAPTTAWYTITGFIEFSANGTGIRQCALRKNGSGTLGFNHAAAATGASSIGILCVAVAFLSSGDYVELTSFISAGTNLTYSTNSALAMVRH